MRRFAPGAAAVWREERESWLFALRTACACLLGLYLAFLMQLQTPSTTAITVAIIALPSSGHVIEKAFYRSIGTLVGAAVSLLLVAVFAQQPVSFLIGLAAWIGLCSGLSLQRRNQRAYAFVLSGYTAFIVGHPAFMAPDQAFPIAVDRVSAVGLGLLCGTLVNAILLPRSATTQLVARVRRRLPEFVAFAGLVLQGDAPRREIRQRQDRLLHEVTALESIRGASYFEDADSRIRSARLRRLNNEFMASCTAMHAIQRLRDDLRTRQCRTLLDALGPLTDDLLAQLKTPAGAVPASAAEAASVAAGFEAWLRDWDAHAQRVRERAGAGDNRELEVQLHLLQRFAQDLGAYLGTYVRLPDPNAQPGDEAPAPAARTDGLSMLVCGLRAMLGICFTGAFWMASGWTHGFEALILVCVFSGLFAAVPNPLAAIRGVAKGFGVGALFTVPFYLLVLPRLDGFAELAAAHLPLFLLFAYWIARPATSARGFGALMMLLSGVMLQNPMHHDLVTFINAVVAVLLGFGFVVLTFLALPLPGPEWMTRRLQRLLSRQLRVAAGYRLADARQAFESGVSDLVTQLCARLAARPEARERLVDAGLAVLESGHALIRLRQLGAADRGLLDAVPRAFERSAHAAEVLDQLEDRLQRPAGAEIDAALRLLQLGLREWRDLLQPDTGPEVSHAT